MDNKILKEGLTYDDVLVVPAYSEVLPNNVNTKTYFSKNSSETYVLEIIFQKYVLNNIFKTYF